MQARRREKLEEEKQATLLQQSLAHMEQAARAKEGWAPPAMPLTTQQPAFGVPPAPPPPRSAPKVPSQAEEKKEWESRKKKREEEKRKKRDGDDSDEEGEFSQAKRQRVQVEVGQGTYEIDGKTYLEGSTYFEILEEDLPIQIWTGSAFASLEEMRLPEREQCWKNALVAAIRKTTSDNKCIVHVSYLASPDDTDETLEKSVKLERIRLVLGGDDKIPDTLEEARLLAMGGEEIKVDHSTTQEEIDEATGFTSWSTVAIKRTTVRQENKEERDRHREKRKAAAAEKEDQLKEAEGRRMEEAKVSNADDSALGAYDVWGKGGYKGVDIQKEADVRVEDTAKSLSSGKTNVAFKKKVKPKGNRNRRRTSADDDDD